MISWAWVFSRSASLIILWRLLNSFFGVQHLDLYCNTAVCFCHSNARVESALALKMAVVHHCGMTLVVISTSCPFPHDLRLKLLWWKQKNNNNYCTAIWTSLNSSVSRHLASYPGTFFAKKGPGYMGNLHLGRLPWQLLFRSSLACIWWHDNCMLFSPLPHQLLGSYASKWEETAVPCTHAERQVFCGGTMLAVNVCLLGLRILIILRGLG